MVLSSRAVLLYVCVCSSGDLVFIFLFVYRIIKTGCVIVLAMSNGGRVNFFCWVFYLRVFFIRTPVSWVIVYKVVTILIVREVNFSFVFF